MRGSGQSRPRIECRFLVAWGPETERGQSLTNLISPRTGPTRPGLCLLSPRPPFLGKLNLLVLTPILRVVTSMVLFLLEEEDRLYAIITFLVLALTLAGLLLLK